MGTDENKDMLSKLNQIESMSSGDLNIITPKKEPVINSPADLSQRKKFAVKIIRARDQEYQKVALKEYKLLKSIIHPGVIKMHDAFVNNARETIYLVMDLCEGECLR